MPMHVRDLELVPPPERPIEHSEPPKAPRQGIATVTTATDDGGLILDADEAVPAWRAASCLLEPGVGDRVWFVEDGEERYVTAVLRRASESGPARLRVDGDAELRADGQLTVAGDSLELRAKEQLGLHGDTLQLQAREGRALFDELSLVLRELFAHAGEATIVSTVLETMAERIRTHATSSLRVVEQLDQLQAGNIEHRATEVAQLAGKHTLINGSELVKADGGQIHLG